MIKNVKCPALLFGLLVLTIATCVAQRKLHRTVIKNMAELQQFFHYEDDKPVIISGHRGGLLPGYPENSIEAMEKTLTLMPSFFEIDPRFTKDSVIVLMHDDDLERVSDMKGKVSAHTYAEIKNARLKDRQGNLTSYRIPTLVEALEWGKDKTIFNLDNKNIPWSRYVEMFKDNKYPNLILSVRSMKEALYYYNRLDNVLLCVAIKKKEDLNAFIATKIPYNRIIAYVGDSVSDNTNDICRFLRHKGVMCFYSFPPTFDKLRTNAQRKNAYIKELIKRPDIIETDYPALFAGMIN
ncbi:glycerophosphodiester phosphodiesterase family protein [Arachidicoccus terrestris]|uniref:glycerophosphodiester phosphodiesterase family protein n=1 Tax=Arachidicoccus terrestris TaxID=2875539 RepID=UPI001CC7D140|nr:glycerophosphodiester phosphodiesterase family protein [Arachidicoccus terrestris]UAY56945.1 glycerophosphodiester phosphodiesterase family protein [Arachidicoccus terrestris]